MSFDDAVRTAIEYAREQAEQESGGDPATSVTADVDGRSGFVQKFKQHGDEVRNGWEIGNAKLTEDYGFVLNALSGTDIQSHSKKIRALRAFEGKMKDLGYNCDIEISTYSR